MAYVVTVALVLSAASLSLTLDGAIADRWHLLGSLRGVPFSQMPTCNGMIIGMLTCSLIALVVDAFKL